jgi:hypothetical protein
MSFRSVCVRQCVPLILLISLAVPATAFAQASLFFPNNKGGCGSVTNVGPLTSPTRSFIRVAYGFRTSPRYFDLGSVCSDPTVDTFGEPFSNQPCPGSGCSSVGGICLDQLSSNQCFTGEDQARRTVKALCYQASSMPLTYSLAVPPGGTPCSTIVNTAAATVNITDLQPASCGFTISKDAENDGTGPNGTHLVFSDILNYPSLANFCQLLGLYQSFTSFSMVVDMMDRYYVQVDPQGVTSGSLTINAQDEVGAVCTFTVPLPNPVNNVILHNAIRDGFKNTCRLTASVYSGPGDSDSLFKSSYNSGIPLVLVANARTSLHSVELSGPDNVLISNETSGSALGVPVLRPWGVGLLVLALLVCSLWLVRRQRFLHRV